MKPTQRRPGTRGQQSAGKLLLGLGLLVLLSAPHLASAQWGDSVRTKVDRFLAGGQDQTDTSTTFRLFPFPDLGYEPVTSLHFGVAGLATLDKFPEARPSTGTVDLSYTLNQQFISLIKWDIFTAHETYYTNAKLEYRFFPEKYWGVGPDTPEANEEDYDTKRIEGRFSLLRNVWPERSLFVGLRLRYEQLFDIRPQADGLIDRGEAPGHEGYRAAGAGLQIMWDTRDNPIYPTSGHYIDVVNLGFHPYLGGTRKLAYWRLDARKYLTLPWDSSSVLAMQLRGEFTRGTPPFRLMPWIGAKEYLRGYYGGRFRDRQLITAQVAYRHHFFWRFGGVAFMGAGVLAPTVDAFRFRHLKPAGGLGLRITLDKKNHANITADYAVGLAGNSGFYLGFGEQF